MTQIDFYQLGTQHQNANQLVCQLCQKAYDNKQYTLLLTQSPEQTAQLDRQLWTFSEDSFIPHDAQESSGFKTPILIHDQHQPNGERSLLINLSGSIPDYFAQFERVIELVTDDNKLQARAHYRYYQERGYPLKHHNL